jgi:H+-transporting ATPase
LFDKTKDAATELVGLTNAAARQRLAEFGSNTISEVATPAWRAFLAKFWAPIPWLLEAAITLQIGLGEYVEASVIGCLLLFNATLGFVQEWRATAALAALKKRLAPTALVCRDGAWVRLPAADLVPGDHGRSVDADRRVCSGGCGAWRPGLCRRHCHVGGALAVNKR